MHPRSSPTCSAVPGPSRLPQPQRRRAVPRAMCRLGASTTAPARRATRSLARPASLETCWKPQIVSASRCARPAGHHRRQRWFAADAKLTNCQRVGSALTVRLTSCSNVTQGGKRRCNRSRTATAVATSFSEGRMSEGAALRGTHRRRGGTGPVYLGIAAPQGLRPAR